MKYLYLLLLIPQMSLAELSECGEYEVKAIVRTTKTGHDIVVNEKTMSEMNISVPVTEQLKLAPYVNRPMTAVVSLKQKFDGTKGQAESILKIETRIPDPMKPGDTGIKLVKKTDCKKS